jgi:hypothetical protein
MASHPESDCNFRRHDDDSGCDVEVRPKKNQQCLATWSRVTQNKVFPDDAIVV